jgi:hypothetical protein
VSFAFLSLTQLLDAPGTDLSASEWNKVCRTEAYKVECAPDPGNNYVCNRVAFSILFIPTPGVTCCTPVFSSSRASCVSGLLPCYGGSLQVCSLSPLLLLSDNTQIISRSRSKKAANEEGEGNPAQQVSLLSPLYQ